MSLAQGNNTPTRPGIEPGSPDPESDALTNFFIVMITIYRYDNYLLLFSPQNSSSIFIRDVKLCQIRHPDVRIR